MQTPDGRFHVLAADLPAGNLYYRTEVTRERATARWIDADHRYDVPSQIASVRRGEYRGLQCGMPTIVFPIYRLQFPGDCVFKNRQPHGLGFGQGKTHSRPLQLCGVASHRVRSTNDGVLD